MFPKKTKTGNHDEATDKQTNATLKGARKEATSSAKKKGLPTSAVAASHAQTVGTSSSAEILASTSPHVKPTHANVQVSVRSAEPEKAPPTEQQQRVEEASLRVKSATVKPADANKACIVAGNTCARDAGTEEEGEEVACAQSVDIGVKGDDVNTSRICTATTSPNDTLNNNEADAHTTTTDTVNNNTIKSDLTAAEKVTCKEDAAEEKKSTTAPVEDGDEDLDDDYSGDDYSYDEEAESYTSSLTFEEQMLPRRERLLARRRAIKRREERHFMFMDPDKAINEYCDWNHHHRIDTDDDEAWDDDDEDYSDDGSGFFGF